MDKTSIIFIIQIILYILAAIAFLFTVLPLFNSSYWIFRIGDFPRLQIAFVLLVVLIFLPLVHRIDYFLIAVEFILAICFAYQISRILPYTRFHSIQFQSDKNAAGDSSIRILISNVLIENRNSEKLLEHIEKENPDVILLAEVDDWWNEKLKGIKEKYPNNLCFPQDNAYGMNFYTKLKTENLKQNFIVEDDIPSVETEIVLRSGDKVKFYGLHPRPPVPSEHGESKERDAELLIVGEMINESRQPTIVAGDLNDVAWSATTNLFQKISGLLDARVGRGFYNSFHAEHRFLRMPLDHVFQSNHFRLVELRRLESIGSDHFPIIIEISLEKDAELEQPELENTAKEKKEADEKILKVKS